MLSLDYDDSDHSDEKPIEEDFNANDDDFFGGENFAETLDWNRSDNESDNNDGFDQNTDDVFASTIDDFDDEPVVPKRKKRKGRREPEPEEIGIFTYVYYYYPSTPF